MKLIDIFTVILRKISINLVLFNFKYLFICIKYPIKNQLQEDLLIHGDSVFDIIDKQDHAAVQAEMLRASQGTSQEEDRLFICRMNVSRNARRQMRFGDQKVSLKSVNSDLFDFLQEILKKKRR